MGRRSSAVVLGVLGCLVAAGCTPTPTVPPGPAQPFIGSFTAASPTGPAPHTTALRWAVSDANGDTLTCALDLDGNGSDDVVVTACTSSSVRSATFATPGTTTVRLTVSDGTTVPVTRTLAVTAGAASADTFGIDLRFDAALTPSQVAAFDAAAVRWEGVIGAGLGDIALNVPADDCLAGLDPVSTVVDDLLIDADVTAIDGPGGTLAVAGPCYVRSTDGLPLYGVMQFDSADLAFLEGAGQLSSTVVHEMAHVLGFGTLWDAAVLTGAGGPDPVFTGLTAVGAWQGLGRTGSVPVENSGGPGTADAHWRESVFGNELMTGYLDAGANPLSTVTIGSLRDQGYVVDLGAADGFGLPARRAGPPAPPVQLRTVLLAPKGAR